MYEMTNMLGAMYLQMSRTQITYSLVGEMQVRDN